MVIKKELICVSLNSGTNPVSVAVTGLLFGGQTPLALLVLAALTPQDYKVTFLTQKIFFSKKDFVPGSLVAITCYTPIADRIYAVADRFRSAGAKVVLGGPHPTALPEEAMRHCDSVVVGEAESVWRQVLSDFENDNLQKIYQGRPLEDFLTPVYPYFQKLSPKVLKNLMIFTRGCRFSCDFCSVVTRQVRQARVDQAIDLIKLSKPGFFDVVHFWDINLYANPQWTKEFLRQLIPLEITWNGMATIDIANDPEVLRLLAESGCCGIQLGIETMNLQIYAKNRAANLKTMVDVIKAIRRIKAARIPVVATFITGLDSDTHWSYFRTLIFFLVSAFFCQFRAIGVVMLIPLPGTVVWERLKKEGRLKNRRWSSYFFPWTPLHKPKNMSSFSVTLWFLVLRLVGILCSVVGIPVICLIIAWGWYFYMYSQPVPLRQIPALFG